MDNIMFVGLGVHKATVCVAVAARCDRSVYLRTDRRF